jgi:hypothetical protein
MRPYSVTTNETKTRIYTYCYDEHGYLIWSSWRKK